MKWKKFTIQTTCEAVDLVSSMLDDLGIEGIEIEDHVPLTEKETKGMFIDILPKLPPDDGTARVSYYLEMEADAAGILEQVREGLDELRMFVDVGSGEISQTETEDLDWMNNWKQFFKPFTIDHILIKPTWEEIPKEHKDKLLVEIDPGTAFGTGSHETTQLCIRQMQKYLKAGDRVLDVGTGSGILGITAIKLGADRAFGTDLDENAVEAAKENVAVNHIPAEQFPIVTGNIIDDEALQKEAGLACYDIVVANILAPVIIMLSGEAARHMKKGAVMITSGIINTKEAEVKKAFEENPDFEIVEVTHQNDWVSVTVRRV